MRDKDGNLVIKNGKVQPDITLQDTENIPLSEEITGKKEVPQE